MATELVPVDQNQIKFNMAVVSALIVLGFLIDHWLPVILAVFFQLTTAAGFSWAPLRLFYTKVVLPNKWMVESIVPDNRGPHRFGVFLGGFLNIVGLLILFLGFYTLGWVTIGLVLILSLMNLVLGFCGGCFLYYQLNKLGVPGFKDSKPSGNYWY